MMQQLLSTQPTLVLSTFNRFDKDRKGVISTMDMRRALHQLFGRSLGHSELHCVLRAVDDTFAAGYVSLEEYLDILDWVDEQSVNGHLALPIVSKEELRQIFDSFDVNENGTLSGYELKAGLYRMNMHFSDRELDSILQQMVGEMNFDQFVEFMTNQ